MVSLKPLDTIKPTIGMVLRKGPLQWNIVGVVSKIKYLPNVKPGDSEWDLMIAPIGHSETIEPGEYSLELA